LAVRGEEAEALREEIEQGRVEVSKASGAQRRRDEARWWHTTVGQGTVAAGSDGGLLLV
jgi:hypothetical protein